MGDPVEKPLPKGDSTLTGFHAPASNNAAEIHTPTAKAVTFANVPAIRTAQQTLDTQFSGAPAFTETPIGETFERLSFGTTQRIQQGPDESSEALHERLRPSALAGFQSVRNPTQIDTPSWYTFDVSKILGIKNAVAVVTSTCKHELPYKVFVGIRGDDWHTKSSLPSGEAVHHYQLRDLGRQLTQQEKSEIYDKM